MIIVIFFGLIISLGINSISAMQSGLPWSSSRSLEINSKQMEWVDSVAQECAEKGDLSSMVNLGLREKISPRAKQLALDVAQHKGHDNIVHYLMVGRPKLKQSKPSLPRVQTVSHSMYELSRQQNVSDRKRLLEQEAKICAQWLSELKQKKDAALKQIKSKLRQCKSVEDCEVVLNEIQRDREEINRLWKHALKSQKSDLRFLSRILDEGERLCTRYSATLETFYPTSISFLSPTDTPKNPNYGQFTLVGNHPQENCKKSFLENTLNCASWPLKYAEKEKVDEVAKKFEQLKEVLPKLTSENILGALYILEDFVRFRCKSMQNWQKARVMIKAFRERMGANLENWLSSANDKVEKEKLHAAHSFFSNVVKLHTDPYRELEYAMSAAEIGQVINTLDTIMENCSSVYDCESTRKRIHSMQTKMCMSLGSDESEHASEDEKRYRAFILEVNDVLGRAIDDCNEMLTRF